MAFYKRDDKIVTFSLISAHKPLTAADNIMICVAFYRWDENFIGFATISWLIILNLSDFIFNQANYWINSFRLTNHRPLAASKKYFKLTFH